MPTIGTNTLTMWSSLLCPRNNNTRTNAAATLVSLPPDAVEVVLQHVLVDDVRSAVRLSATCKLMHGMFRVMVGRPEYKASTGNLAVRVMLCAWQAGVPLADFHVSVFGTVQNTVATPRYNELILARTGHVKQAETARADTDHTPNATTGTRTDTEANANANADAMPDAGADIVAWTQNARSVWPAACRVRPVFVALARMSVFGGVAGMFFTTDISVPVVQHAVGERVCVRGHMHACEQDNYTLVEFVVDAVDSAGLASAGGTRT